MDLKLSIVNKRVINFLKRSKHIPSITYFEILFMVYTFVNMEMLND